VTSTAVIQVKRGIGDVIWHLPFVRAIAGVSSGGRVTFLAPPSSCAKALLAAEPSIATTLYFEHGGSELQRGINLVRLAALLRRQRFRTVWILDRTMRPALAARLASVPERIGLGLGAQRLFITNPGVDHSHFHDHPIDWLRALMEAMNVPLPTTEPALPVAADLCEAIGTEFGASRRPWIVLGLGAMDPARDWSENSWLEFLNGVRTATAGTVFLIGGAANTARAQSLIARTSGAAAINACDLDLGAALALLSRADLFVGTDSGPMNLAAAVGTPAFVMFGVNRVLDYSKFIHPIVPDGGPCPDGMTKITPAAVLERVRTFIRAGEPGADKAQG
jgi:heptosyltransferase-2